MEKSIQLLFTKLKCLQSVPVSQLTPGQRLEIKETLTSIRIHPRIVERLTLPTTAWSILDEHAHESTLELVYARRLTAQYDAHLAALRHPSSRLAFILRQACLANWSRIGNWLLHSGLYDLYLAVLEALPRFLHPGYRSYARYREREDRCAPPSQTLAQQSSDLKYRPRISILMAVHNPNHIWLRAAVQSVIDQVYSNWQLCICEDRPRDSTVHEWLLSVAASDDRITVASSHISPGISNALNQAASLATGDFVAFLDQDDLLNPSALYYSSAALQEKDVDIVYTDEDLMDAAGVRMRPHFKPGWSPTLLRSCMYFGHLVVMRRTLFQELDGFLSELDGAQDYDLVLRATELTGRVSHVPRIAYHWRMHRASVAARPGNKPYTHTMGGKAVESALQRRGIIGGIVTSGKVKSLYFTDHVGASTYQADIVLIAPDPERCSTVYSGLLQQMTVANAKGVVSGKWRHVARRADSMHSEKVITVSGGDNSICNAAELANAAATVCGSDVLMFVDGRLRALEPRWAEYLVGHLLCNVEVGIVGGSIVRPSGEMEHVGVVVGMLDGVGYLCRGSRGSLYWPWLFAAREVGAVGMDCFAVRRGVFEALGGFDLSMAPYYHVVDLCLRARELGYSVTMEPRAVLCCANEGLRQGIAPATDWEHFLRRWSAVLSKLDRYYTPNLALDSEVTLL